MTETTTPAAETPAAPGKETFVVYGQNRWGKGDTLADAKKVFQQHGGQLSKEYAILTFDAHTTFEGVDQMGRYYFKGNEPTEKIVPARRARA